LKNAQTLSLLDTPSRAGARILLTAASLFCRDQRGIGSAALQGCLWSNIRSALIRRSSAGGSQLPAFGTFGDSDNSKYYLVVNIHPAPTPLCTPNSTQGHPIPGPPTRAVFAYWGGRHPRIGRGLQQPSYWLRALLACWGWHRSFSSFAANKSTSSIQPKGGPCVTLGPPLGDAWVTQGPRNPNPNPKPNPSRQRVANPKM